MISKPSLPTQIQEDVITENVVAIMKNIKYFLFQL